MLPSLILARRAENRPARFHTDYFGETTAEQTIST